MQSANFQDYYDPSTISRREVLALLAKQDCDIELLTSWRFRQRQVVMAVNNIERRRRLTGVLASWRDALALRRQRRRRDALRRAAERARLEIACDALLANLRNSARRQLATGLSRWRLACLDPLVEASEPEALSPPRRRPAAATTTASATATPPRGAAAARMLNPKAARPHPPTTPATPTPPPHATPTAAAAATPTPHATPTPTLPTQTPATPIQTPIPTLGETPTRSRTAASKEQQQQQQQQPGALGGGRPWATPWSEVSTAASVQWSHGRASGPNFTYPKVPPLPILSGPPQEEKDHGGAAANTCNYNDKYNDGFPRSRYGERDVAHLGGATAEVPETALAREEEAAGAHGIPSIRREPSNEQARALVRGAALLTSRLTHLGKLQLKKALGQWTTSTQHCSLIDAPSIGVDTEINAEETAASRSGTDLQELRDQLKIKQLRHSEAEEKIRQLVERGEVLEEEKARLKRVVEAKSREEAISGEQLRALEEELRREQQGSAIERGKLETHLKVLHETRETLQQEQSVEETLSAKPPSRQEGRMRTYLHLELARKETELERLKAEKQRQQQVEHLNKGVQLDTQRWAASQAQAELRSRLAGLQEELAAAKAKEAEEQTRHSAHLKELSEAKSQLRDEVSAAFLETQKLRDAKLVGEGQATREFVGAGLSDGQLKELDCYAALVEKLKTEVSQERHHREVVTKELHELRKSYRLLLTQASQRRGQRQH